MFSQTTLTGEYSSSGQTVCRMTDAFVFRKRLATSPVSPQHSAVAPRVPVVAPQPNPQAPQHAVQGPPTAIQTPLPTVQTPRPVIKWVAQPPNGPQPMQRGPMPNLNSILDTDPFFYSYGDPDMSVRMLTAPYLIRRLREEFRREVNSLTAAACTDFHGAHVRCSLH